MVEYRLTRNRDGTYLIIVQFNVLSPHVESPRTPWIGKILLCLLEQRYRISLISVLCATGNGQNCGWLRAAVEDWNHKFMTGEGKMGKLISCNWSIYLYIFHSIHWILVANRGWRLKSIRCLLWRSRSEHTFQAWLMVNRVDPDMRNEWVYYWG